MVLNTQDDEISKCTDLDFCMLKIIKYFIDLMGIERARAKITKEQFRAMLNGEREIPADLNPGLKLYVSEVKKRGIDTDYEMKLILERLESMGFIENFDLIEEFNKDDFFTIKPSENFYELYKKIPSQKVNLKINSNNKKDEEQINLGPLSYKNKAIYYNDSILKLAPQNINLCKLFMETPDEYISDERIRETISKKDFLSNKEIQKRVSGLRRILKKENNKIDIKRFSNSGYMFMIKRIL